MESIWMGIAPSPTSTRVLAMDGAHDTFLKARLARTPTHRHALSSLLEAIALWQGRRVRAALCVDDRRDGFDSTSYLETFPDVGNALYSLDWIPARGHDRRVRRDIAGMGRFADLRDLLLTEVAR